MEKGPNFRIIGEVDPERKNEFEKNLKGRLFKHAESLEEDEVEINEKFERPKTEKEVKAIEIANEVTSKLMNDLGVPAYDVPVENYHIIDKDKFEQKISPRSSGSAFLSRQGVILKDDFIKDNLIFFSGTVLHETLHLKGHLTMEIQEGGDGNIYESTFRSGVSVEASQKSRRKDEYHEHFAGLHEAIVSETEKRLLPEFFNYPEFKEEKDWAESSKTKKIKNIISKKAGIPEDEILWTNGEEFIHASYPKHRKVLDYVCGEIYEQFPDKYKDNDKVLQEFQRAHFSGNLLPIARAVEETFGEGSFRLLGNMSVKERDAVLHLETLKNARRIFKKAS